MTKEEMTFKIFERAGHLKGTGRVYWMHKTTRVERKEEIELERGKEEHKSVGWQKKLCQKHRKN